jgi:MFS transporter, ACDE family, multidrug resistance protein
MLTVRSTIPATIATLPRHLALAFLSLFFFPGVAQALLLTVVPLEALTILGSARSVTLLYVATGLVAVIGRFSIPYLVTLIQRRFVFTLGTLCLAISSTLLALDNLLLLAIGLVLSTFAFACLEITSQLYLLDHVPRHALKHFEPIRIFAIAGPWTLGPWFGVYLQRKIGFAAPFTVVVIAAALLLTLFWSLPLSESAAVTTTRRPPPNPVLYLRRFFVQPRLRLAWTLAAARSSWWSMFYVYTPIFAVTAGLGAEVGGVIASIGTGWIWLVPVWGWVGRRLGLRRLLQAGYAAAGLMTLLAALSLGTPLLGATMLVLAALGTETIDGAGNLLFLRAVHPYERPEMTTVFVSFRDVAQLGPPAVCSVLLSVFSLPSIFTAAGIMMLASSLLSRRIPRRL